MIGLMIAAAAAAAASPMPSFLTGCWEQREGQRWTQECWTDARAGQMMGSSREGIADRLKSWEWMRIVKGEDGAIALLASPQGAAPTPFAARTLSATSAEFINPANDYPQRIRYELRGHALEAEISLIDGSKPVRWSYRRNGGPQD